MKYRNLADDLKNSINAISDNPRYKSHERKLKRIIETWKTIIAMHMTTNSDDALFYNYCHAFQSAVSWHIYKLDYETAMLFINTIIDMIRRMGDE